MNIYWIFSFKPRRQNRETLQILFTLLLRGKDQFYTNSPFLWILDSIAVNRNITEQLFFSVLNQHSDREYCIKQLC